MFRRFRKGLRVAGMTDTGMASRRKRKEGAGTKPVRLYKSVHDEIEAEGEKQHRPNIRDQIFHIWEAYKILMETTGGVDNLDIIREEMAKYRAKKDTK